MLKNKKAESTGVPKILVVILLAIILFLLLFFGLKSKLGMLSP